MLIDCQHADVHLQSSLPDSACIKKQGTWRLLHYFRHYYFKKWFTQARKASSTVGSLSPSRLLHLTTHSRSPLWLMLAASLLCSGASLKVLLMAGRKPSRGWVGQRGVRFLEGTSTKVSSSEVLKEQVYTRFLCIGIEWSSYQTYVHTYRVYRVMCIYHLDEPICVLRRKDI